MNWQHLPHSAPVAQLLPLHLSQSLTSHVFEEISNGFGFVGSFQKMYEQLRQENIELRDYMGKMQKPLDASDLGGTD